MVLSRLQRLILAAILLVFLQPVGTLSTAAQAPPSAPPIVPGAPWEPPQTLARFVRDGEDKFPLLTTVGAALKSYPYRHQALGTSLHLYRRDALPTMDGATTAEVAKELGDIVFTTTLSSTLGAATGKHQNNKSSILDRRAMWFGASGERIVPFQQVIFRQSGGPDPRDLQLFLTAWASQFMLVNFGYAAGEPADDEIRLFMSALVRALPR